MTKLPDLSNLPILEPKRRRAKCRVSPQTLPMLATICPADIVGSFDTDDGTVGLVLEGNDLPDSEFVTLWCEARGAKSIVEIKPVSG